MKFDPIPEPKIRLNGFSDVRAVPGDDLQDMIATSYSDTGIENTLLVTRSNKRATLYNLAIRTKILTATRNFAATNA